MAQPIDLKGLLAEMVKKQKKAADVSEKLVKRLKLLEAKRQIKRSGQKVDEV